MAKMFATCHVYYFISVCMAFFVYVTLFGDSIFLLDRFLSSNIPLSFQSQFESRNLTARASPSSPSGHCPHLQTSGTSAPPGAAEATAGPGSQVREDGAAASPG